MIWLVILIIVGIFMSSGSLLLTVIFIASALILFYILVMAGKIQAKIDRLQSEVRKAESKISFYLTITKDCPQIEDKFYPLFFAERSYKESAEEKLKVLLGRLQKRADSIFFAIFWDGLLWKHYFKYRR